MKYGIELNGIANALILIQCEVDKTDDGNFIMNKETHDSMVDNIKILEKYMLAYCTAVNAETAPPAWHEVRDNPTKYPNNNELHRS